MGPRHRANYIEYIAAHAGYTMFRRDMHTQIWKQRQIPGRSQNCLLLYWREIKREKSQIFLALSDSHVIRTKAKITATRVYVRMCSYTLGRVQDWIGTTRPDCDLWYGRVYGCISHRRIYLGKRRENGEARAKINATHARERRIAAFRFIPNNNRKKTLATRFAGSHNEKCDKLSDMI